VTESIRPRPLLPVAVAVAFAFAFAFAFGCATSKARIYRSDGPPLAAEIESSDQSTLVLRGPPMAKFDAPEPRRVALGQYQVSAIDHPGNVLSVMGLGYAFINGVALLAWTADGRQSESYQNWFGGPIGFAFLTGAVTGLAVAAFNGMVWGRSKANARAFEEARPPEWLIPPPAPGQSELLAPPQLPPGTDDEIPGEDPRKGFHR
jgi:hypothetical protein